MLGKAREINIAEMEIGNLNKWFADYPEAEVLSVQYAFHPDGVAFILIVFKEATPNAQ